MDLSIYINYNKDSFTIKKKLGNIAMDSLSVPGALFIKEFPTSTAGVPDVENWLKRMEELKKIKK